MSLQEQKLRTLQANAKMWAMLRDLSRQIPWMVNHKLVTISAHDWKYVLSACYKEEVRLADGINGGFVLLGQPTSSMSTKDNSDLIEFMYAFGADRGVKWSEPEITQPTMEN